MITSSSDLLKMVEKAKKGGNDYINTIDLIGAYKWYNWYLNLHIKENSIEDLENTRIFEDLKINHPKINKDIENIVERFINKQMID